jgi:benzoyl-CoA reductase/2-hydroxyglutaryl-CoA dehydratase subunit BcrC/BadD/HgdB
MEASRVAPARREALASPAFRALSDVYLNRRSCAQRWKGQGKRVAATLGCDVPDEILIAAGMLPIRVCADPLAGLEEANKYLEFSFDPVVRAQFEGLINGSYAELADCLVISNSTDVLVRIYFYLREIRRIEPQKRVPALSFIDWLFTRFMMHQERNERTLAKFLAEVEAWAGSPVSAAALREACALCNENRAALREFSALRRGAESRVTGAEALTVIGAGLFMEKQEHTSLVRRLTGEAAAWQLADAAPVFLTGSVQEDTTLYELIEDAGMNVVSEDHDWGDRHMDRDVDTSLEPMSGIVDRYSDLI